MDNRRLALALLGPGMGQAPGLFRFPAYAGLRNSQELPPFEAPGSSLPMDQYMATQPVPGMSVEPSPVIQPQPMPSTPVQATSQQHATDTWLPLGDQDAARNARDIANGGRAFNPATDTQDPNTSMMVDPNGMVQQYGPGVLPDVQSAIDMLVKQGVLGGEWMRR